MAYESPNGFLTGAVSAADLSSSQFLCVKLDTAGKAVVCDTAGELVVGVLQNDPIAEDAAAIMVGGISKVVAAGAIANAGVLLATDADGKVVEATSGQQAIGVALEAASAADAIISMFMLRTLVA